MYTTTINDDAIAVALSKIAAEFGDMSTLMDEIGQALVISSKDRIEQGVTPDGTPFALRSGTTVDRYIAEDKPFRGPLYQSGDMASQINHSYGPTSAQVGSNAIQAAVMQFGAAKGSFDGASPWGDIPARPFLGISDQDRADIPEIVEDWFATFVDPS